MTRGTVAADPRQEDKKRDKIMDTILTEIVVWREIAVSIGICVVTVRMMIRGTIYGIEQCCGTMGNTRHPTERAASNNQGSVRLLGRLARMLARHPSSASTEKTMMYTTLDEG